MGLNIDLEGEFLGKRETLIETKYLGNEPKLNGTTGEAFYDAPNGTWKYRPYKQDLTFHKVSATDLDCANDSGWVKGEYTGTKEINREGKATWNESTEMWDYKPKGFPRVIQIPENDFVMGRDEDY